MPAMSTPRIAVGSGPQEKPEAGQGWAVAAVQEGGAVAVEIGQEADGLVWLPPGRPDDLRLVLAEHPEIRWVQLPFAGVEAVADAGLLADGRTWTCAKGSYGEPVAEHALLLALAGLRRLPQRIEARSWGRPGGISLFDQAVTILGGGGITAELLRLLAPYRVSATVVRRRADPMPGATRTVATDALHSVLPGALVVFVALALTPETVGILGADELALMDGRAYLVNVARGRHVDTDALADALDGGVIAGAGLDVTEPEPLPDGHRLWDQPRCIITPHTADTWEMVQPMLAARIRANAAHFAAGEPLEGLVDPTGGY
jgi:phosphoglycerate dehydrogenase-like enzyme